MAWTIVIESRVSGLQPLEAGEIEFATSGAPDGIVDDAARKSRGVREWEET